MTSSIAIIEGKKAEEGMTISAPEHGYNPMAITDPPERQTLMPATTE
jgi:hypothetical protein